MNINLANIDFAPGQGGGVRPSGTLEISGNGLYDVYSYASASVDVHPSTSLSETYTSNGSYSISGEFNGGTVNVDVHPSTSLSETYTSNGSYSISGEFNGGEITIEVPIPQFITETLSVSVNNTYYPGSGINGFSEVVVDVPQSVIGITQQEYTEGNVSIVNLYNSASFVKAQTFANNSYLETVNLSNCTVVQGSAFHSCANLQTVSFPVCTNILSYAFGYCRNLSSVYLPVCSIISEGAFTGCYSILSIDLPSVTYVYDATFYDCNNLKYVNIPNCQVISGSPFGVVRGAFGRCDLESINLPVCSLISNYAFQNNINLSQITLGYSSVCTLVAKNAFENTPISNAGTYGTGTGSIYVPASLVDAYKSAYNWADYSDRIFPISE